MNVYTRVVMSFVFTLFAFVGCDDPGGASTGPLPDVDAGPETGGGDSGAGDGGELDGAGSDDGGPDGDVADASDVAVTEDVADASDVAAPNVGCKVVGSDHCMCVDDPTPDWTETACSPATVEKEPGDTGFCCDGYFCDCKAVACRYSQGLNRCTCGQSTVASVSGGDLVTTCPNAGQAGIKCCKYSGSCKCSTTACLAGIETEVASCGVADVMECEDKEPVDACL